MAPRSSEIEAIVTPGARKERVTKKEAGKYAITVKEEAARNAANTRVREIIAEVHRVPVARVRMLRGARSHKKVFTIIT
jgi:uncharacterized protein YggU (UPF0235/DUF167 family)